MALQAQVVPVKITGFDTKGDDRWHVPGELTMLRNARYDNDPQIEKRWGYAQTAKASAGALLAAYKNQLLIGTGSDAQSYTASGLIAKGVLESMSVHAQPVVRNGYAQQTPDSAVHSLGVTVYTYESIEAGATIARYSVFDTATAQPIVTGVSLGAGTSRPKPLAIGNYVVVVFFDGGTSHLRWISIPAANPTAPSAAADLAIDSNAAPVYDATVIGGPQGQLFVAYATNAGKIAITFMTSALVVGAEVQPITAAPGCLAIFGGVAQRVWLAWYAGTTLSAAVFAFDLSPLLATTAVDAAPGGAVRNVTGIIQGDTATVLYEITAAQPYNALVKTAAFTVGGAVSGVAILARSVGLASKPFLACGRVHVLAARDSTLQRTYFLLAGSTVVGKLSPGLGGGLTVRALLPEACSPSEGVFSAAYLQTDRIVDVVGTTITTQAGVQAASFDFTAPQYSLELSDDLHITGGLLSMYDGQAVCEHGFHAFPENATVSAAGADGGAATGDYLVCFTYEWMDNYGLLHQSSPSAPQKVTAAAGNHFAYVVDTLRLTAKPTPVVIVAWRTLVNVAGTFYRVSQVASPLLNDPTADTVTAPNDLLTDAQLTGKVQLYSAPGNSAAEIPNLAAPAPAFIGRYRNRAVIIPAENPFQWVFSKAFVPGVPIEFNDQQLYQPVEQEGGPLVACMEMDEKIVLFKRRRIYYAVGDGPSPNGLQSDYGSSPFHVAGDVGCVDPRSLVLTPHGIMFRSEKGIYLLTRGLETIYIGSQVEQWNDATITGARAVPNSRRVVFTTDQGVALAYDYTNLVIIDEGKGTRGQWSEWTNHDGADLAIFGGLLTHLQPGGSVMQETPGSFTDNGLPVLIGLTTSWLSFAGISGFQRVWRFVIRGDYKSPHQLRVTVAVDDNPAPVQAVIADSAVFTPGAVAGTVDDLAENPGGGAWPDYAWTVKLARQKCASVQVTIQETQTGPDYGEGFALSALTFLVGRLPGMKRGAASRVAT